eukprot:7357144-Karenia_brevis.AAC.1
MAVLYSGCKLQIAARAKFKCPEALRVSAKASDTFKGSLDAFKPRFPSGPALEEAASVAGNGIEHFVSQQGTHGGS